MLVPYKSERKKGAKTNAEEKGGGVPRQAARVNQVAITDVHRRGDDGASGQDVPAPQLRQAESDSTRYLSPGLRSPALTISHAAPYFGWTDAGGRWYTP